MCDGLDRVWGRGGHTQRAGLPAQLWLKACAGMPSYFELLRSHEKRELQRLLGNGVPLVLVQLVALVFLSAQLERHDIIWGFETFAGEMAVTNALNARGFAAAAMELKVDPTHDIMTSTGFLLALVQVLRLGPGGLCWLPSGTDE